MFNKNELISLLEEITTLLEFKGENSFKISAFRNAAFIIQNSKEDFETLIRENKLDTIKGIGKGLQAVINEFYESGESSMLKELKQDIPETLFDLFSIRGLGPKKIYVLYHQYHIADISSLEDACKRNIVASIKGFGAKTQEKILESIEKHKEAKKKVLLNYAERIVLSISEDLGKIKGIEAFEVTGEYRKVREVISSLDFVLLANKKFNPDNFSGIFDFELKDNYLITITEYPIPVKLHITGNKTDFIKKTVHTTGSDEFLDSIFPEKNFDWEKINNEKDLFIQKGVKYIPPELWETEYCDALNTERVISNLDEYKPLGMLHFHTDFSDGTVTLKEMVKKGMEYGFEYFAVCDHSKSAFYANGLNEERVLLQKAEVERLKKDKGYKVFHGIESDILPDGRLDFDNDFLSNFDFIVGSVHSSFSMTEEEMTKRIIKAIENPFTDVIGHLTGRLLLYRSSYQVDVKKVLDACAANSVAIEINASPHRLELDWRYYNYAREKDVLFAINQDAHSTDEIRNIEFGIRIAKKGGIQADKVINYFSYSDFQKFLKRK